MIADLGCEWVEVMELALYDVRRDREAKRCERRRRRRAIWKAVLARGGRG